MKLSSALLCTLLCSAAFSAAACPAHAAEAQQTVTPLGTYASARAAEDRFAGQVRVDRLFNATKETPYTAASVTFEPGARTNWHSHPAGQHLIVTAGKGLTGTKDGKVVEFRAGDEIYCPPDVVHWHGASPSMGMTHIAITGIKDGKSTSWGGRVSDEQYNAARKDRD